MKQVFTLLLLSLISYKGVSQFSVFGKYQTNTVEWQENWQDQISNDVILSDFSTFGVAYWLRFKNYRVEFHPGLYYSTSQTNISSDQVVLNSEFAEFSNLKNTSFGVEIPIQFYFLDIEGDCNCPTFSKDGDFISKGLFGFITPGYNFSTYEFGVVDADIIEYKDQAFTISAGIGLDIGLGNLITVTPFAGITASPNNTWEGIAFATGNNEQVETSRNYRGVLGGIRLALRPDFVKERRAMFR